MAAREYKVDERCLLATHAGFEIERLERLLSAIEEWDSIVQKRLMAEVETAKDSTGELSEWVADRFGDEASMLEETKRFMCAGVAVSIASITEAFGASVCHFKNAKHPLLNKAGQRPTWGHIVSVLEKELAVSLSVLPGYQGMRRARLLGNCFKHKRGRADDVLEKATGITKGSDIRFQDEDWRKMIDDTKTFILDLAGRV